MNMSRERIRVLTAAVAGFGGGCQTTPSLESEADYVDGALIQFTGEAASPNGAWCWFQDERVIVNTYYPNEPVLMFTTISASKETEDEQSDLDLYWYGLDHRYHLARLGPGGWQQHEIAYGGERLYAGEDDYTGLVAIDPEDVNQLVISSNADPVSGAPLISSADHKRHYEIFEGKSSDGGKR